MYIPMLKSLFHDNSKIHSDHGMVSTWSSEWYLNATLIILAFFKHAAVQYAHYISQDFCAYSDTLLYFFIRCIQYCLVQLETSINAEIEHIMLTSYTQTPLPIPSFALKSIKNRWTQLSRLWLLSHYNWEATLGRQWHLVLGSSCNLLLSLHTVG